MSQMDNGAPRRIRNGIVATAVLMLGLYAAPAAAQDTTQVEKDTAAYAPAPVEHDTAAYAPAPVAKDTVMVAPAPVAERAVPGQVNVELAPVASSGISGTAVLASEGEGDTEIEITLKDSAGNDREYDVTLRAGTCMEPGEVVEEVDDTEADGDPEDEGADLQLAAILSSPHIIHVTEEGGDAAVACGEVKGME